MSLLTKKIKISTAESVCISCDGEEFCNELFNEADDKRDGRKDTSIQKFKKNKK